jgi:hypothetical protein
MKTSFVDLPILDAGREADRGFWPWRDRGTVFGLCKTDAFLWIRNESWALASVDLDQYTGQVDVCSASNARNICLAR